MSPLVLSALLLVGLSSLAVGTGVALSLRRRRRSWESIEKGLEHARRVETELEDLRASLLAVTERHLPPEKAPKTTTEALIALDGLLCAREEDNQLLHRRLLDSIRSEHTLHQAALGLREKIQTLESRPAGPSDVEVRALQQKNDALRTDLRSAQRLIAALEAQLRSAEEEREAIESLPDTTGDIDEAVSPEDRTDPFVTL